MFKLASKYAKKSEFTSVNLGGTTISVPLYDSGETTRGKMVLITAGVDGDEYAGIEAAYDIIDTYKNKTLGGRLVVIPILNIPGFNAGVSENPLDGLYPKHIYPGKSNGKPSERLIHWLVDSYVSKADVWLDLHCGAHTEELAPFLWAFETGNERINRISKEIIRSVSIPYVVFQKNRGSTKATQLAERECLYLLNESGELGMSEPREKQYHKDLIDQVMTKMQLIGAELNVRDIEKKQFSDVWEGTTNKDTAWKMSVSAGALVQKGDVLGFLNETQELCSGVDGTVLWISRDRDVSKGETVLGVGFVK